MKFPSAFVALAVLCPFLAAGPAAAHGDDWSGFTDQSLTGNWGFSASGVIVPPAVPAHVHAAAVGIMTFDGAGGCVISDTINLDGQTFADRQSTACSYQVNEDGTGTITAQFASEPFPVPLSFVIVGHGHGFRFIRTDAGVASGEAQRQAHRRH